jgi:prevent-host-death family protein
MVYLRGVEETRIQASVFKSRCLAMLDEVEASHRTFVVTKNGRPVAKLVPWKRRRRPSVP